MKRLKLGIIAMFGLGFSAFAQQKVSDKAVIKTPTVHCEKCKERIENFVLRQYGVSSVKVDVKKKTTTVSWLTDRTNIEVIKTAIANAGYDADEITADETAFKRLPKDCRITVVAPPVEKKDP